MNVQKAKITNMVLPVLLSILISGCAGVAKRDVADQGGGIPSGHLDLSKSVVAQPPAESTAQAGTDLAPSSEKQKKDTTLIFPGSGKFLNPTKTGRTEITPDGNITLNFENTDIREVVKVILTDQLNLGYVIDPLVQGGVTLQTGKPLKKDDLLPTLEMLLRMNGAAMINDAGVYRIMPIPNAMAGNLSAQLGYTSQPLPNGYTVRIVPLEFIGAAEMETILKPLASDGSVVRVDVTRNLLILAGTGAELSNLIETIRVFDVDWMSGLSVGFFPLEYSKSADMLKKIHTIIGAGENGPIQGLIKVLPIESANGLLVVTPQKRYLDKIRVWIERLDSIEAQENSEEQQFYVYKVRNGEAVKLSELLSQLFSADEAAPKRTTGASISPGQQPVQLTSSDSDAKDGGSKKTSGNVIASSSLNVGGDSVAFSTPVKIVADETRNLLLITASAKQYTKIQKVLDKLDITPLQVLIEATIIEVRLQGDLEYGLQWFFRGGHSGYSGSGSLDGTLDSTGSSGLGGIFPGFNYSLIDSVGQVRAVFSALAEDTNVKVLSSPSVMVLDNQQARIQVGDQVPIATQQQQDTSTSTSTIVNSIQYRDTGIVLDVKPRVTPGGLVTMEVEQEVSDVSATQSSTLDSPTISTRKITSTVAVQNGHAIVLGGLIRDRSDNSQGGVPGLYKVPVLGWLFGQNSSSTDRTELVVILVPKVVAGSDDSSRIVEDFRGRLKGLKGHF
ncbi:MAG: type II secretion system protein GspD [Sedimenticola sp.]|nr:MAG: type II secretion system protein GspD [Sedimenticola sp.]